MTVASATAQDPGVSKPLRVGLDVRMARSSGIGTYLRALRDRLRADPGVALREVDAGVPIYTLREQLALPGRARALDLFHAPHYNAPLAAPCPLVVTIHDLAHLVFPAMFPEPAARAYAHAMFRAAVARARRLIAVSAFTRDELRRVLGVDPGRVTVIHHGLDPRWSPGAPTAAERRGLRRLGVGERYVLYVGNVKPHKNVLGLVEAFGALTGRREQLVIAGQRAAFRHGVDDLAGALRRSPARDRIVATGALPCDRIRALYRGATAVVLPSLYEGFGLPVLEAMACGAPVIASDRASIPEVADDAAVLLDATVPDQLAAALERVLDDATLRRRLAARGLRRAAQFSWTRAAQAHVAVYREVVGERG